MDREHVILFAGPMGAGKTTAIASLSDIPMVTTEAINNDTDAHRKATTTVAMDYGQITMSDCEVVRLYGVPGQDRFDFMWRIFEARAVGLILLLDANTTDIAADLDHFLDKFRELVARGAVVIGITQTDAAGISGIELCHARLRERHQFMPVFEVDARSRDQMIVMLSSLVVMVQMRDPQLGAA